VIDAVETGQQHGPVLGLIPADRYNQCTAGQRPRKGFKRALKVIHPCHVSAQCCQRLRYGPHVQKPLHTVASSVIELEGECGLTECAGHHSPVSVASYT
jgi:hypothetical protein